MKRIFSSLAILFLVPLVSFGGGIKLQFQGGLGSYSMTDIKTLNLFIMEQIPLSLHQTNNFPPFLYYQGAFLFNVGNHISFGPMYAFQSTGSRYSLADYSGQYYFDDLIHANSLGMTFNYQRLTNFNLNWGFYLDGGMSFSKVEFKEHFEFTEVEDSFTERSFANETSFFAEPGISLGYPIKFIEPGIRIGYLIPFAQKGLKESESNQNLYLPSGKKVKSGWNGFRIGMTATFSF